MKLTKEQVYVLIDNQSDCDRAIEILTKAGEKLWQAKDAFLLKGDKRHLKTYEDMDWGVSYYYENRTQITLDELESLLTPKIKKSELKMEIEDLKEEVSNLRETLQYLIDETKKVTIVHPPIWANEPSTVIGKGTIEGEEDKPQFQVGTLGAFWDGDWDNAVDETSIITARLDKIVLGAYKPINRATCFQNFKPLKFD